MPTTDRHAGALDERPGAASRRREVAQIQRARLLAAAVEAVAQEGAAGLTVGGVVSRAGVSRRTFYEIFKDGEQCLLAAIEEALACAQRYARAAYDPEQPWRTRVRAGLEELLRFAEEQPGMARLLVVETLGAGSEVLRRRGRVLARLTEIVNEGAAQAHKGAIPNPLAAEAAVGGVLSILHTRLTAGQPEPLLELAGPLMSAIVLPYLGPGAARAELAHEPPRAARPAPAQPAGRVKNPPMRLTYRTMRVLRAIASHPQASNREVGLLAGIADQGQTSKLLGRLERLGLAVNGGAGAPSGARNAWQLTEQGEQLERATASYAELPLPATGAGGGEGEG